MQMKKYCLLLLGLLVCVGKVYSQKNEYHEFRVIFKVNRINIERSFARNDQRMQEIVDFLKELNEDKSMQIVGVNFCGAASPEGSDKLNRWLAKNRLQALEKIIRRGVDIPDSIITRNDSYIPWNYLKTQIEKSDLYYKDEVLAILQEDSVQVKYHGGTQDRRIIRLKGLENGKIWKDLFKRYFTEMRNAYAIITIRRIKIEPIAGFTLPDLVNMPMVMKPCDYTPQWQEPTSPTVWTPKLYLKTNALALGMAISNIGVEADLGKHVSVTLPIYYSAWNYFKSTIKFRTLAIQPEIRYWFSGKNDGLFTGAHIGISYFNFAFDGDYRYQDYKGKTPAIGYGLSIGYRLPISKNNRWKLEFSVGAGYYPIHYDKFHNTPNVKDGLLISDHKKKYWGIDQAAITFSYMFDQKKKGGK